MGEPGQTHIGEPVLNDSGEPVAQLPNGSNQSDQLQPHLTMLQMQSMLRQVLVSVSVIRLG